MKDKLYTLLLAFAVVLAISLGIWYEMFLWSECRLTNSFFYCLRVVTK